MFVLEKRKLKMSELNTTELINILQEYAKMKEQQNQRKEYMKTYYRDYQRQRYQEKSEGKVTYRRGPYKKKKYPTDEDAF